MNSQPPESNPTGPWRRRALLGTWTLGIALVWCVVLPRIAERPATRQRLQFLDDRGIDPSAMFYTELDCMGPILEKLEGGQSPAESR